MARPSVVDFGAIGDGSETSIAINNAAFAAAAAAGEGNGGFTIPGGKFLISETVVGDYSYCSFEGDDRFAGKVVMMAPKDIIAFDFSARSLHFCGVSNVELLYGLDVKPTEGAAIRLRTTQTTPQYGMTNLDFSNIIARYTKYGFLADKPAMTAWDGIAQIANYGHMMFDNIHIPYNNEWTEYGIKFKGGPGAHNSYRNGNMSVTKVGIEIGDGTSNCGVGDQLFDGLHILNADHGIVINGPGTWGRYNENVTIDGCQFDGIGVSTVKMRRMENFRIRDCNSTSVATYDLATCRRYSVEESGVYGSEYTIRQETFGDGSHTIPLFDVAADSADTYRSVYAEVYIDTLVGGVGNRPILWRGFLCYNSGSSWSIIQKEELTNGTGASLSFGVVSGKVRCTLNISGATSGCKVDGTFKLMGRNYSVTKL